MKKHKKGKTRRKSMLARKKLTRLLEKNKKQTFVLKTRGQLEHEVGMSGLADIDKCLHYDPTDTDALLNRAELYVRAGQNQYASEDFEAVLELDPENVRCYINRGVYQIHRSRPAKAIQDFDHALLNDPSNPLALYNRAVAYTDAKQYDQAIDDYTTALEAVPTAVAALRNRGLLHLLNGNSKKAKKDLSLVLELVQDSPEESQSHDLLPSLGQCQAQLGLLVPEALDSVNRAMHHRGGVLVDALVSRGSVYYDLASAGYEFAPSSTYQSMEHHRLKTHDEIIGNSSIDVLESELGRSSLNARSKSHRLWVEMSISDFSKALRLKPSSTTIRANLAEALSASADSLQRIGNINGSGKKESMQALQQRKRKRIKLALKHFSAVLGMDPGHASALNGRGVVYLKLGKVEEAYTDLTLALVKIEEGKQKKRTLTEIIAIRKAMNKRKVGVVGESSGEGGGTSNSNALGSYDGKGNKIAKHLLQKIGREKAKLSVGCLVVRAMVFLQAGSSTSAEQDLVTAIGFGERHGFATPFALHDLGTLRLRAGKNVDAIDLFKRAIQTPGPHVPLARMSRGIALCTVSPPMLDQAMDDFNAAVLAHPSNVHGLYNRAVCLAMSGNLRKAEEDLVRAIAIAPGDKMLYDQRGNTVAAMGRTKQALKDFATSLFL